MYSRFLFALANGLKQGSMLKSKYATVESFKRNGFCGYLVRNNITGLTSYIINPFDAAIKWHSINMCIISKESYNCTKK